MFGENRKAMIPCILLALGGNLIDGKLKLLCRYMFLEAPTKACWMIYRTWAWKFKNWCPNTSGYYNWAVNLGASCRTGHCNTG